MLSAARLVGKENVGLCGAGGVPGAPRPAAAAPAAAAGPPRLAGEPLSISPGRAPSGEDRGTITGSLALQPMLTGAPAAAAAAAEGAALMPAIGDRTMLSLDVLRPAVVPVVSSEGGEVQAAESCLPPPFPSSSSPPLLPLLPPPLPLLSPAPRPLLLSAFPRPGSPPLPLPALPELC